MKRQTAQESEQLSVATVILDERLDITNIASLVDHLLSALNFGKPIDVDVAKLESIDTAGLQVLVAFANSARALALTLNWHGVTSTLTELSELANVERYLDLFAVQVDEQDDGLCPVF